MSHCPPRKEDIQKRKAGSGVEEEEQYGLSDVGLCLVKVLWIIVSEVDEIHVEKKTSDEDSHFLHKASSLRSCAEETEMELLLWEARVRELIDKSLQDGEEAQEVLNGADDCLLNIEELLLSIVRHFGIDIPRVQTNWLNAKRRKEITKVVKKSRRKKKLRCLVDDLNHMYFEDIRLFRNQLHAFGTLLQKMVMVTP